MSDPRQNKMIPEDAKQLKREQDIPRSTIRRNILLLAWPVIVELGLLTFVEILDMIMVGHVGIQALKAVGVTIQPLMLGLVIFNGMSVGTTALVARFIGERNQPLANKTFQQSLLGSTFLSLIMVIVLYYVAPWIMILMGNSDPEIIQAGTGYIHWMLPGLFFQWVFVVISASLRGAGDTKTPMFTNVVINIVNLIFNYLLIFGIWIFPKMGVYGAGLASSIARFCGFLMLLYLLQNKNTILNVDWQNYFRLDWPLMKRIIRIGAPASAEQFILRFGQTLFTRVVNGLSDVAFAAHTTAINAESLSYMPGWGFSVAATTMVGQKLGEKKPKEAEASGVEAWKFSAAIMGFMGIIFLIFPEYLMRLYADMSDPNAQELIRLGARNLRIISAVQLLQATQFVLAGALRGAGYTKPVLYSTMVGVWGGRLLCSLIFVYVFHWGLVGAWIAMCLDWVLRASYALYLWKKGEWKKVEV